MIDATALKGILECMHSEADERDKHSAQIRDIVKAAKEKGFDGKALRKVFVRQRMNEQERTKQDDLLEAYEHALGAKGRALAAIAGGAKVGEAAAANGVHRATVARARNVAKQVSIATPNHDPETGEIAGPSAANAGEGTSHPPQDAASPTIHETALDKPPLPEREFEVAPGTISDAQALANLEEVEAAFFLRRDSTRVVA